MKRLILLGTAVISSGLCGAQKPNESFEAFRRHILKDYQDFRETVLRHYADFLDGTWHEYEPLTPMKRDATPKPVSVPDISLGKPALSPVDLPSPRLAALPAAERETPVPAELPETPPDMPPPPEAENPHKDCEPVNFYGMEIWVPKTDFTISDRLEKVSDFARHWRRLDEQDAADKIVRNLTPAISRLGLNDYLAFEFICAYFDSKFPGAGISPRMSAVHYVLANMGYNARIAVITKTGEPIILIPAEQTLYAVTYLTLGGENFYVLGGRNANTAGSTIATCDLPKGASSGKKFDMIIDGLNLPVKERKFEISSGGISLSGVMNENLIPVVYRYPQMDTGGYARSVLDKDLRSNLVEQIRSQLGDKEKTEATDNLLHFVQNGFEYATDDSFHGFEKPYFLEENLYYPKNDCEDRAIFYTYMLWNALGVENHLIAFPGHESASVALSDEIKGTSYEHGGKRYYISDPTYIGSRTGQCMPDFVTTPPIIDMELPEKINETKKSNK